MGQYMPNIWQFPRVEEKRRISRSPVSQDTLGQVPIACNQSHCFAIGRDIGAAWVVNSRAGVALPCLHFPC